MRLRSAPKPGLSRAEPVSTLTRRHREKRTLPGWHEEKAIVDSARVPGVDSRTRPTTSPSRPVCAVHTPCAQDLTYIVSLNPHITDEETGSERPSNSPWATQQSSGKASLETLVG